MGATTLIIVLGLIIYLISYWKHGKYLEKHIVKADASRETPAKRLYDGVDYVPANKYVLYGHHFASIAGGGPIVGPSLALAWGWLPALLWIWFGNVFIGVVHDYLSLMCSVRYDGRSIGWISGELMSRRAFYAFTTYIWFKLITSVIVFLCLIGILFSNVPGSATAALLLIVIAIFTGFLMYRTKIGIRWATLIGVTLVVLAIIAGVYIPIKLSYHSWIIVLAIYAIIAASLPVWVLLQPRDYLNAYLLWASLAIGAITALLAFRPLELPAVTSLLDARIVGGLPSPFWPTVPLVIACGALSGFHSLVSSGTSSKQLASEVDGLLVGYGGMLTEGFLSTMVIAIVAAFGLEALIKIGLSPEQVNALTDPATMAATWTSILGKYKWFTIIPYSYATATNTVLNLPFDAMVIFATLWITSFALTTLDTATRLGRYAWQELMTPLKDKSLIAYKILANRWVASVILVLIAVALAWGAAWKVIWPAFAGINQLLASLALMTISLWVIKVQKVTTLGKALVLSPAFFLWVTVTVALIWYEVVVIPALIAKGKVLSGILVGILLGISLILNLMLLTEFFKKLRSTTTR